MKLLLLLIVVSMLGYAQTPQVVSAAPTNENPPHEDKQVDSKKTELGTETPAPPADSSAAEEEIKKLKKQPDSIPALLQILEKNPPLSVVKAVHLFILELDPLERSVMQAVLNLAYDPHPVQRDAFLIQLYQGNEAFFTALRNLLKTGTVEEKTKAAQLLVKRGQREIDAFLELLQSTHSEDQEIAKQEIVEMGNAVIVLSRLVELVESNPHKGLHKNALAIFKTVGKNNIPALFVAVKDGKDAGRRLIIQAMTEIGRECISPSIGVLRLNPDPILREALSQIAIEIGPSVIADFLPFIEDPIPEVRDLVQTIIKKFDQKAVDLLIEIIQNADQDSKKIAALKALETIAPSAVGALDILKPLLTKEDELQYPAILVIQNMGEASQKVIPELQKAFQSKNSLVRAAAANSLAHAQGEAFSALSLLRERLKINSYGEPVEYNAETRMAICRAIGSIGPKASAAIPELMTALKDIDENVVRLAAEALGNIGPKADRAADALIQILSSYGTKERESAAKALAKIGRSVLDKLIRNLRNLDDASTREGAAMALRYMGKTAQPAIYSLIAVLRMEVIDLVKRECVAALGEIGANSSEVLKVLIEASRDESPIVRDAVAEALGKMGKDTVPHILMGLRRASQPEHKIALIQALGFIGTDASEALPSLKRELLTVEGDVQKEVIKSLSKIGADADTIVPLFIDILKKSYDEDTHNLIREALLPFGKRAIDEALPLLKDERKLVKQSGNYILDKLSAEARPALLQILHSSQDDSLIAEVVTILGKNPETMEELLKLLRHPSPQVKKSIVAVLGSMNAAVPHLVKVIQNTSDMEESKVSRQIIIQIGVASLPQILAALKVETRSPIRAALAGIISDMGDKAQMAITPMVNLLIQWQGEDRKMAAQCLGKIGVTAIPYLVDLLNNKDKDLQQTAIFALGETRSPEAIVYLLKSLKNPQLLSIVIDAMIKMKNMAVPILIKSLNDENTYVRFACAAVLMEIADLQGLEALRTQEAVEKDPMIRYLLQNAIKKSAN